ncbi:MAG: prop effector ProQ [Rhizobacter sp.]
MSSAIPASVSPSEIAVSAEPQVQPPLESVAPPLDAAPDAQASTESSAVEAAAVPAAKVLAMSPAQCGDRLRALFPALFSGAVKPLKLRIQVDIQARAPGVFSKQVLSAFFRRHTGSTSYLIAVSKAPHRVDLDGQPAGEVNGEHKQAALEELARRRANNDARRQQEEQARLKRASLLRSFQNTTLTRANFCALNGLPEEALDAVLAQAEQEAKEAAMRPGPQHRGPRPPERSARPRPSSSGRGSPPGRKI